jgi:hypothetical protein
VCASRLSRDEGLTYAEIGAELGVTESAAKRNVFRALDALRIKLAAVGITAPPPQNLGKSGALRLASGDAGGVQS